MNSKKIIGFLVSTLCLVVCFVLFTSPDVMAALPVDGNVLTIAASPLVTIFTKDIQEGLYPDNEYYQKAINDDAFVVGDKVNLPQAGAKPSVSKNRSSLPATIAERTDTSEEYSINEFTSDPTLLKITDELHVAYNKRASILNEHRNALQEKVANNIIVDWAPSVSGLIKRTTGVDRIATASSATGNRKAVTKADFIAMFTLFNNMNIPMKDRYALMDPAMYEDILNISDFTDVEKFGRPGLQTGIVTQILGFNIMVRSSVLRYTNAGTPAVVAEGAAGAATHNLASIFWHKNYVRRALGAAQVLMDEDKPEYYGSIFSTITHAGGRIARTNQEGVAALVQGQ